MHRSFCYLAVVLILSAAALGDICVQSTVITWDDLRINEVSPGMGFDDGNRARIIVVDRNGTGDSTTVQGAVDMVPDQNNRRVKIYILPGIYREKVLVPKTKPYISFIGNESRASDTVITWHDKAGTKDANGNQIGTFRSASVNVESDYFCAAGITFENSNMGKPGDIGRQAVALKISGDKAMFYRVTFIGKQDTLLDDRGSHYFYQSNIQGSIDFIFGRARSLYERCVITSTAERYGSIAAHHRDTVEEGTGFSFVNCVINGSGKVLLARAWGPYSTTIYSRCYIEDVITPEGWSDWDDPSKQRTAIFGTYNCRGAGAETGKWVPWAKSFTYEQAMPYLNTSYINGEQWLRL